jgi:hypothetical protein
VDRAVAVEGAVKLYVYIEQDDTEEEQELGECADAAAADKMLAEFEESDEDSDGEWCCAELFDEHHKVKARRTPSSAWIEAIRWPEKPERGTIPSIGDDARRIAVWLTERIEGCFRNRLEWDNVLSVPFPGRERGEVNRNLLDPTATLRDMKQHDRGPVESVVAVILQEGIEIGALLHREKHNCDARDARLDMSNERYERLLSEFYLLRAEIARLKGETP